MTTTAFAAATGIGSWPGTSARDAAEVVVGELHTLTHLVELPARGVGADLIGRAGALLVDITIDTVPRGYRVATRPGAVARRAVSLLGEDLDALEEAWEKAGLGASQRTVKIQAPGPITLAAQLELGGGHRAITDAGALRDLTESLAEGIAVHRAEVARRLGTTVVVQLDEPSLPAALAGRLTGVTGVTPVHPVDEAAAVELLDIVVAAAGTEVALHCCAADLPWKLLQRSAISAVSVDVTTLQPQDLDGIGEMLQDGTAVMLGVVPAVEPAQRRAVEQVAEEAARITDRLGFNRTVLRERVGITPACGLAGATLAWARTAIGLAQSVADGFEQDPEAI
ncbi:methionine synthase [Mycolicibacterium tokaiense]|uniref:Methionine synthase, vitamin-B12 independent n=1 Tax=Mycolicibacterium tokaiense TaxID=39695 RepID=A0A378TBS9_9MYCO|nr:methionine synthase [Mycolicibacterium tokaiense]BBY88132.1 methionine synthase [Mycolicibacterium tokaiense]STZ57345.1 methionine synthase, vitamin-B12 independent [Mycolicibacterium tokaiense]